MKELAESLLQAFWETGWGHGVLMTFFCFSLGAVVVLPMLRPVLLRSRPALLQDARRTAELQLLVHGALLGASIVLGKAVCVDRVVSNPWGSFRAHGDLLSPVTLCGLVAVYVHLEGAALKAASAIASPQARAYQVNRLGGLMDALVVMPVLVGTYWEMCLSLHRIVPWVNGLEVWLLLLVPVGLVFRCLGRPPAPPRPVVRGRELPFQYRALPPSTP